MITLLAESKTFSKESIAISPDEFDLHTPRFEKQACEIMHSISSLSVAEISAELKLSAGLASAMWKYVSTFTDKSRGLRADEAFTGEVFRALSAASLDKEARERLRTTFRFVSSLYGYLLPDDIIRPYRLDFTSTTPFPGIKLSRFWKETTLNAIEADAENDSCHTFLNLLPADAVACLDFKSLGNKINVISPVFKEMKPDGSLRTPGSGYLKKMRGLMARLIADKGIKNQEELLKTESLHFAWSEEHTYDSSQPVFIC